MHAIAAALPAVVPTLGPKWMDPTYLLDQYGSAFFVIALVIIFVECGLLFPILPGDSLLFAVGLFIATGQVHLNLGVAIVALCVAAFLGNVVGYEIGRGVGRPLYKRQGRFINTANFDKTNAFFDKYGNRALGARTLRAHRAHVHHRRRRHRPDAPPALLRPGAPSAPWPGSPA